MADHEDPLFGYRDALAGSFDEGVVGQGDAGRTLSPEQRRILADYRRRQADVRQEHPARPAQRAAASSSSPSTSAPSASPPAGATTPAPAPATRPASPASGHRHGPGCRCTAEIQAQQTAREQRWSLGNVIGVLCVLAFVVLWIVGGVATVLNATHGMRHTEWSAVVAAFVVVGVIVVAAARFGLWAEKVGEERRREEAAKEAARTARMTEQEYWEDRFRRHEK